MSVASQLSSQKRKKSHIHSTSRRRDKRRHATSSSSASASNPNLPAGAKLLKENPYDVIALSIRYDESMNDEEILNVPLESGSLYNDRLFTAALMHLQKKSTSSSLFSTEPMSPFMASASASSPSSTSRNRATSQSREYPNPGSKIETERRQAQERAKNAALTPIILSGYLAQCSAVGNSQGSINQSHSSEDVPPRENSGYWQTTSTELVQYTQQMRRAALARVKFRKERQRIQRIATPALILGLVVGLYFYTMNNLRSFLDEYGFVDSCESTLLAESIVDDPSVSLSFYQGACREAESVAWEKLNQAQLFQYILEDCTVEDCSLAESLDEKPPLYTMHTQLQDTVIPLEDILGQQRKRKRKKTHATQYSSNNDDEYSFGVPAVKWLGDSMINRLVGDAIASTYKETTGGKTERFCLLDAGSGLSGLLFFLLDFPFREWSYTGITISHPEAIRANQLLNVHRVFPEPSTNSLKNVTIHQASFDDSLPVKSFHSIVAVESLGFSRNISKTIANLAGALKPKGSLIIVEDAVATWAKESIDLERLTNLTSKKSLLTHQDWARTLATAGLEFKEAPRDLTLEFDWMYPSDSEKPFEFVREGLQLLSQWYGRGKANAPNNNGAGARGLHLLSDLVQHSTGNYNRQVSYRRAELTLMMYTCVKK
jgi:SAM-dependent methyltransferase